MANGKSKTFKIGDVCRMADVQPYVLRYWETEFEQLAPGKSGGGQRFYTQDEVDIVLRIKELLYSEGFTIAGAKKKLESEMKNGKVVPEPDEVSAEDDARRRDVISEAKRELREILEMLK
ncbi:MAG: MerR family transcriptional regulator [Acidobacteria bacterium]|nr:MerR family transcriptional regulator [Acidobacteriota bacterium]